MSRTARMIRAIDPDGHEIAVGPVYTDQGIAELYALIAATGLWQYADVIPSMTRAQFIAQYGGDES